MHNFRELKVWKAGIDICKAAYQITRNFPAYEQYGLTSQITRAAISIPSNIAEGCGRKSSKELYRFLSIALGSCFELETQFIISKEFGYVSEETLSQLTLKIVDIQKMLSGLQKSLQTN